MNGFERIAVCVAVSLVAHVGLEQVLDLLPPLTALPVRQTIQVKLVEPPPPQVVVAEPPPQAEPPPEPEPPKPIEPPKPDPVPVKPVPTPLPAARPAQTEHPTASPDPTPPSPTPKVADDSDDGPVFGVDMNSTSTGGPGMVTGHGGHGGGGGGGGGGSAAPVQTGVKQGTGDAPIGAADATKMPLPQGRCFGKYTPEATAAGTEGVVTLDLTVDEHGHARDITATTQLPNGLTASAIAALRDCTFSPGEKNGAPTAVRIRGFKVRFAIQESQP